MLFLALHDLVQMMDDTKNAFCCTFFHIISGRGEGGGAPKSVQMLYNKDDKIHKSEGQSVGQTNINSCRMSELNKQNINEKSKVNLFLF